MYYIVTELQVNNGTPAVLTQVYGNRDQAYAKYFTVLAAAAVSSLELHGAYIATSTGAMLENHMFDRREE